MERVLVSLFLLLAAATSTSTWGTFRPNVYFGVKSQTPASPLFGLMWFDPDDIEFLDNIRHDCEEHDKLTRYGWLQHDVLGGTHEVIDSRVGLNLTVRFTVNPANPDTWVARVTGLPLHSAKHSALIEQGLARPRNVSLLWYLGLQDPGHAATLAASRTGSPLPTRVELSVDTAASTNRTVSSFRLRAEPGPENAYMTLVRQRLPGKKKSSKTKPERMDKTYTLGVRRPVDDVWNVREAVSAALLQDARRTASEFYAAAQAVREQKLGKSGRTRLSPAAEQALTLRRAVSRLPNTVEPGSNLLVFQQMLALPFSLDFVLEPQPASAGATTQEKAWGWASLWPFAAEAEPEPEPKPEPESVGRDQVTLLLADAARRMSARFEATFGLRALGYTEAQAAAAQAALANMVGGVGHFFGQSLVQHAGEPVTLTEPYELLSSVPSRSFFPRGFLWDEGFHQLLVGRFDHALSQRIIENWISLADQDGWIGREQILGAEARRRVPEQFRVQRPHVANPPAMLLALRSLLDRATETNYRKADQGQADPGSDAEPPASVVGSRIPASSFGPFLTRLYPHLERWVGWFFRTQFSTVGLQCRGETRATNSVTTTCGGSTGDNQDQDQDQDQDPAAAMPDMDSVRSFRWRGRTLDHCLASGLDDYPRAGWLTDHEGHADLHAWMVFASRTLADMADWLLAHKHVTAGAGTGVDKDAMAQAEAEARAEAEAGVECDDEGVVHDFRYAAADDTCTAGELAGWRESSERWRARAETLSVSLDELHWNEERGMYLDYAFANDTLRHVDHAGYVSLFPLLLNLVPSDSPKLGRLLSLIGDPLRLWSPYGLRSLARDDPDFGSKENYWRGPIWINLNFLAVDALRQYARAPGPHADRARALHQQLRGNVVDNLLAEYARTGYLWEQYDAEDGKGRRSHPFTGWTALLVLMMADA